MSDRPLLLVTGGGRGIGAAVCRMAAARGHDVVLGYRQDEAAAQAVAADVRAAGGRALAVRGDMVREEDINALFKAADGFGPLRHVVNNAGVTGRSGRLDATPAALIRETVDLNVTGAILVAREAVRRLSTRHGGPGGSIVNLSSMASVLGAPGEFVWYAATKAAIDALTTGLSREVATEGVRVNAVQPGMIATEIHALSSGDPGRLERMGPMIPMGRPGTADEVAEAVLWLTSDAASYVTGATLRVSGGR